MIHIITQQGEFPEFLIPFEPSISAGFPSPAADFLGETIDLRTFLMKNPSSTFFARADGNSMKDLGIEDKDILVIDKSLKPTPGRIAICVIENEFLVKQLTMRGKDLYLMPANTDYKPIKVTEEMNLIIWGIVTHTIKDHL